MLILVLSAVLTAQQQAQHDAVELAMYNRLRANDNAIADMWRPSPKLLSDERKARRCYTEFHLYKVEGCEAQLIRVEQALKAGKE